MKSIVLDAETVQAIVEGKTTLLRQPMDPQPVMEKTGDFQGMWHFMDCQWMDKGIGFPRSGIKDHAIYQPGEIIGIKSEHKESAQIHLRVKDVRVIQEEYTKTPWVWVTEIEQCE